MHTVHPFLVTVRGTCDLVGWLVGGVTEWAVVVAFQPRREGMGFQGFGACSGSSQLTECDVRIPF